jgi:hypothetical protein
MSIWIGWQLYTEGFTVVVIRDDLLFIIGRLA